MLIAETCCHQAGSQCLAIKLWIVPRAWNGPHVNESLDPVRFQQCDEVLYWSRRMADGPNCLSSRHKTLWHGEGRIATDRQSKRVNPEAFFLDRFREAAAGRWRCARS